MNFRDAYLDLLRINKIVLMIFIFHIATQLPIVSKRIINNFTLTFYLFFKAKENNDELDVQAALLRISTFLSGINRVLEQTTEDVDRFIKIPDVAEFVPES